MGYYIIKNLTHVVYGIFKCNYVSLYLYLIVVMIKDRVSDVDPNLDDFLTGDPPYSMLCASNIVMID